MLSTSTVRGLRERHTYEVEFQQNAKEAILCGGSVIWRNTLTIYFPILVFLFIWQIGKLLAKLVIQKKKMKNII